MKKILIANISRLAVADNLRLLRSCLEPGTKLCAVVKGDCYGHGIELLLETITEQADWLAVVTGTEAIEIRELGYAGPLLMLFSVGAYGDDELAELIRRDVTLTAVNQVEADRLAKLARRLGQVAQLHVMVDTGMTRSGILTGDAPELIDSIASRSELKLTGIYTHLATADESDKSFASEQIELFTSTVAQSGKCDGILLHAANSAATIELPFAQLDMVRPGLSICGYQPADKVHNNLQLKPAMKLTAPLMQIKSVPVGTRCGYGLTYSFSRPSVIGLVPVGYADGYHRENSNRAVMQVGNKTAPVRGMVSMDQTIIDLTDIPEAAVGDEVTIISDNPSDANCVNSLAELVGTVPQEITSRLGGRIRKQLVD